MELIYTYIHEIDNNALNLEFLFSDNYDISYSQSDKRVTMTKRKSVIPEDFFSENISKINIVAGKNASRKTTLLNILGFNEDDLLENFKLERDSWFSIYRISDETYFLQGCKIDLISNINKDENVFYKQTYACKVSYDFKGNMFSNLTKNEHKVDKLRVIYLPTEITSKKRMNVLNKEEYANKDHFYAKPSSFVEILNFLKDDFRLWDTVNNSQNLEFIIEISKDNDSLRENKDGKKIYLYNDKSTINTKLRQKKRQFGKELPIFNTLSTKEVFILSYLENQITESWNSHMDDFHRNNEYERLLRSGVVLWDNQFIAEMNSLGQNIDLSDEKANYRELYEHLINLFLILSNKLKKALDLPNDRKFGYTESIIEFVEKLNDIEEQYFEDFFKISIPLDESRLSTNVQMLLELMDKYRIPREKPYNTLSNTYNTKVTKLSDGQLDLINFMSRIRTALQADTHNLIDSQHVLLLLDEPGLFMHPEWLRRLIEQLVKYLKNSHEELKFSIIITTHSPFLISDVPDSLVLKIIDDDGKLRVTKGDGGYGNNIFNILHDTFFLDSPIGSFAEEKIDTLLNKIRSKGNEGNLESEINLIEDENIRIILLEELKTRHGNNLVERLNLLEEEVRIIKKQLSEED